VSSEKCLSLPFYKAIFFDPSLQSSDYAIEAGGSFKKDEIFFTKVMKRDEKGEVLQTISIAISVHVFMNYLTQAQGYKGVYTIALFGDKDLIIFEGQDPSLIGKQLIIGSSNAKRPDALHSNAYDTDIVKNTLYLKELSKEVDTYGYSVNGKLVYATVLPVVHMNFGILISRAQFEYTPYLRNFFYNSLIFFVSIILFGSIGAWILTYLMATPLRHLCEVMAKVGNEDLKARYVQSLYGFEINRVGDLFNITLQKLLDHLQRLHSRVLKQEVLKQELYIGHEIQKSLVPTAVPEVPGIEIKTGLIPAKEVGGDFYDLFINRTDELLIVMADTAGHGVSGCFYSLMMRSILRTLSSTVTELKDVIIKANEIFYKDSAETLIFVTTWVGSYNQKTKLLQYSSCGHPLGFIFRNQKLHQELVTPGIALGVIEEVSPVIESISLQQGDILVFITDGLIETRNSQGEMFGKTRFIQVVEKHFSMDITSLFENIIQELEIFEEDPDNQEDDVTMVVIRIK
jgi:sigma-B regulation protein RsbU (phosphoserine phosphatase)